MNRTLRRGDIVLRWALAVLAVQMAWSPLTVQAAPTPQQAAYWWQDEVRTAAFAVSRAGTGRVARWPAMTVSAGSATLPLPVASSPITPDGKLDEPAWQQATTFPVGPIFDDWHLGPMTLQVSVCRDEKNVYLAIESPRDLTGLGALTPTAELLSIGGKPYRVGPGGNIPDTCIERDGPRQVIELALPATGDVALTFPVETARRIEGKLPAGFDRLGLHQVAATGKRDGKFRSLWLDPIGVRLVRANWAVRLTTSITDDGRVQLASVVLEPGKTAPAASENLTAKEDPAVYPYQWQTTAEGKTFTLGGFVYLESIAATLAEARKMGTRSTALGSTKLAAAPSAEQIAALEAEARQTSPADRTAWRKLHNRAREVRARLHL
ncbi:MAG: hypothetical protein HQ581_08535, partial [Planctomycetes bacterium]|nr:hypothetical protein [Planctomycetota bacterium]